MYFPLFVDLSDKNILVVGGGTIATRRVLTMAGFAGQITVIAPEVSEDLLELEDFGLISIRKRLFQEKDLNDQDMALIAINDEEQSGEICELCRQKGILVNVSSDRSLCDFQFPSIVADHDLVIGINASGNDHGKVKETRQKVEKALHMKSLYE